jgi:AcrR family transcriptional regulator
MVSDWRGMVARMSGVADDRPLRADAVRNRDAILAAAREVFAERGVDVALEEIAQRAGVGIGTLYRRFPCRRDLIAAVFEPKLRAYADATQRAVAEPDPWLAFGGYVRELCAMQAADAGFADVVASTFPVTAAMDLRLRKALAGVAEVVARAKAAGVLREDFVMQDLAVLLLANAGVVTVTMQHAPQAWERFAAYMLDAFRAPGATPLPAPVAATKLARAVRRR